MNATEPEPLPQAKGGQPALLWTALKVGAGVAQVAVLRANLTPLIHFPLNQFLDDSLIQTHLIFLFKTSVVDDSLIQTLGIIFSYLCSPKSVSIHIEWSDQIASVAQVIARCLLFWQFHG